MKVQLSSIINENKKHFTILLLELEQDISITGVGKSTVWIKIANYKGNILRGFYFDLV